VIVGINNQIQIPLTFFKILGVRQIFSVMGVKEDVANLHIKLTPRTKSLALIVSETSAIKRTDRQADIAYRSVHTDMAS